MRASVPRLALALALSALAPLVGCDDAKDPTEPTVDAAAVAEAAGLAAVAVPDGDRAARLVAGLLSGSVFGGTRSDGAPLDRDAGSSPPPNFGGAGSPASVPACPATQEAIAELDATCVTGEEGLRFEFGGAVDSEGGPTTVEGTLAATPSFPASSTAVRYDLSLAATVATPGGTATWSGSGTVDVDAAGTVSGYRLAVSHALAGEGSSSLVVTPAAVDVLVPSGTATVRFFVDRGSGSGSAQVDGATVALLSFTEGCLHLDWLDPGRADERVCPDPSLVTRPLRN
jgi:hypothetical protein